MLRKKRPDAVIYGTMCPWGRPGAAAAKCHGRLAALATELLSNPGYQASPARIGASLREAGGVVRPAEAIEKFVM